MNLRLKPNQSEDSYTVQEQNLLFQWADIKTFESKLKAERYVRTKKYTIKD